MAESDGVSKHTDQWQPYSRVRATFGDDVRGAAIGLWHWLQCVNFRPWLQHDKTLR